MVQKPEDKTIEPKMDRAALYREEIFTDRKVGTIRRLTPVKVDGSSDNARKIVYVGEAQAMTPMGALPLTFEIEAQSLDEAISKYADGVKKAFERALQELQELRRQASSSIVIPQGGVPAPGGVPSGGKIQLR